MALSVERSSLGVTSICQSSSPALDSERIERRDDMDWAVLVESAKRPPRISPWKSVSSSQFSMVDEAAEAMRCAKLPLLVGMAAVAGA
jgi:hypothetical protein